ncbi:MAG: hypothetical protein RLZZ536_3319 [Planctomycetota bacterium]
MMKTIIPGTPKNAACKKYLDREMAWSPPPPTKQDTISSRNTSPMMQNRTPKIMPNHRGSLRLSCRRILLGSRDEYESFKL